MATKVKNPYKGKGSAGQNRLDRREKTRKEEKCQWCHAKVPLEDQFVVFNDFETETTKRLKDATKKGREKYSHYCEDCSKKRQAIKQAGDFDKASGKKRGRPAKKGKAKAAKKATAKKSGGAKKAGTKKRRVVRRKGAKAGSASKTSDPF